MKIREQLSPGHRRIIGLIAVCSVIGLWFILTLPILPVDPADIQATAFLDAKDEERTATGFSDNGGQLLEQPPVVQTLDGANRSIIPSTILPSPIQVITALGYLHREQALVRSALVSFFRITVAFCLAALVAIPLGILMGTYPTIRAAIEPLSGPLRYLPVSAVTGLFILLLGIGEEMKISFLFVGIVVYLLPIVIESVEAVDDVYLQTAYTLGASQWQIIRRVLVPASWPAILEACRVIYGIGWTYVILAELINAKYGLGYLITIAYRRGHIDWAYALVLVVLLLGVGTNEVFRQTSKRLFKWKESEA